MTLFQEPSFWIPTALSGILSLQTRENHFPGLPQHCRQVQCYHYFGPLKDGNELINLHGYFDVKNSSLFSKYFKSKVFTGLPNLMGISCNILLFDGGYGGRGMGGFRGILLPYVYSLLEKFHMQLIQENRQILKSDESWSMIASGWSMGRGRREGLERGRGNDWWWWICPLL